MKTLLSLPLFGAACALAASAQTNPPVSIRFSQGAKAPLEIAIRNQSNVPVTAYSYTVTYKSNGRAGQIDETHDTDILFSSPPVGPNAESIRRIGGPGFSNVAVQFHAAVFADGTSYGDSATVSRIKQDRATALKTFDGLISRLQSARQSHAKREAVVSELQASNNQPSQSVRRNLDSVITSVSKASNLDAALQQSLRNLQLARNRLAAGQPAAVTPAGQPAAAAAAVPQPAVAGRQPGTAPTTRR